MPLQLEIISEHRDLVGDDAVRVFREEGGTIGRSLQNDWILPDPDRFISGRHASIDFRGGIYYLLDTSTNGVYVNNDCEPIGKGNPRRLFNGDRLRFGDFEMVVTIDSGESLQMPAVPPPSVSENSRSMVEEDILKTGMLLLEEDEITGDDEFQSALFGSDDDTGVAEQATPVVANVKDPVPDEEPLASWDAEPSASDLVDSFLDGVGVGRSELHPSTDLGRLMQNAGEVLREYVEGTTRLLASRANMKGAFRLEQTTVLPRHNNPIKLSANVKDSIQQLLVGEEGEYLGPRDSVREVCRDLLFHQDAFLDAMNQAFAEFADRFDPDELEDGFDHTLGRGILARFLSQSKYWGLYRDLYPILTDKGGGRLPQLFAEEFVKAYERQIAEFKRLGTADDHLKATVVLNKQDMQPAEPAPSEEFEPTDAQLTPLAPADLAQLESDLAANEAAHTEFQDEPADLANKG